MEAVYEPGIATAWNVYAMCKVEGGRWREIHDIVGAGARFHSREIKRHGNEGRNAFAPKCASANHSVTQAMRTPKKTSRKSGE